MERNYRTNQPELQLGQKAGLGVSAYIYTPPTPDTAALGGALLGHWPSFGGTIDCVRMPLLDRKRPKTSVRKNLMTRSTEEVAADTSKLIDEFMHCDTEISKRIAYKSKLMFDVIEYVRIINMALFSWRDATDAYLKERNLGSVRIEINKEQPIFLEGDDFLPKHFPIILGAMTVDIKGKIPFSLKAPLHFTRNYGWFIWESGRVGLFYSECHLARNHEKFGNQDLVDWLSLFGNKDIYIGGQYQVLRHPGDVINEELYQRLSDHLITHLRD